MTPRFVPRPPALLPVALAAALGFTAPAALGQVSIGTIDRRVFNSAFIHHPLHSNYGSQESYENISTGQWFQGSSLGPSVGDESGFGSIAAIVGQQGDVTTTRLFVTQQASVDISSAGSGSADVDAHSVYAVTFTLFTPQFADVLLDFGGAGGSRGATLTHAGGGTVFSTDQDLEHVYTLSPGTYTLTSQVGFAAHCGGSCAHVVNPTVYLEIDFTAPPAPACPADMGVQGGNPGNDNQLDNNDFVIFIGYFFSQDWHADLGRQGGLPGADGHFDNNDFVVFIDEFFGGCP